MTDIVERLSLIDDNSEDVTWYFIVKEAAAEIERLRVYKVNFESVARDNERMEAEIERLREHLTHRDKEIARLEVEILRLKAMNAQLSDALTFAQLEVERLKRLEPFP